MAGPRPVTSPWVWEARDYLQRAIRITVPFNETTREHQGATIVRDVGCRYQTIYVDVPDSGRDRKFTVPTGTTEITTQQLRQRGFTTIEDIIGLQITAGPGS